MVAGRPVGLDDAAASAALSLWARCMIVMCLADPVHEPRTNERPAMHHPTAWQPPVTGAYLGMGTNSGTNSPSPVHALQHPAYGMNGKTCLLVRGCPAQVSTRVRKSD